MKKSNLVFLSLGLFLGLAVLPSAANAACSNPAGVEGEQIYNEDHNVMQFCDGTDWTAMKGDGTGSGGDNLGAGGTTTGTVYSQNASGYGYLGSSINNSFRFDDAAVGDELFLRLGGNWEYYFGATNFRPYTNNTKDLGLSAQRWKDGWFAGTVTAGSFSGSGSGLTAIPGTAINANSITAGQIAANAVGTSELAANAVTSAQIAADTITAADIATNAVGTAEIAADAVTAGQIAANAVGTSEIINNSITTSDILDNTITENDISNSFVARDSNLLDGINSTSFIRSDAADTVSGTTEWQNSQQVMFGNNADFGMFSNGTAMYMRGYNHGAWLYIQGEDSGGTNRAMIYANPSNEVRLYYAGAEKLNTRSNGVQVTGSAYATSFLYTSDLRLKENAEPLKDARWKLKQIPTYRYNYKADAEKTKKIGVMAQDVIKVYPEAVSTDEDGMMAVDYPALVPALIQAVNELSAEVEALKAAQKQNKQQNQE